MIEPRRNERKGQQKTFSEKKNYRNSSVQMEITLLGKE
jgi:hypothetical protein